ncbi:polysaccharide deacetylase family protein [Ignavibacterium sp.]|uniref:polysaccharide deacetylase family protein n=1 Tax=Ignavibacterium sp. TaxID=2651167 RepID=UPI00307D1083
MKSLIKNISFIKIVFFLIISFNHYSFAQIDSTIGKLTVTKWADNRLSAFSFSFDDGLKSQYINARTILNQFNFRGTYFILPPYLTNSEPTIWRYGTWPMFQQLATEQNEIGSHTLNHLYLTSIPFGDTSTPNTVFYELYHSQKIIEERIPDQRCISLAYPFADHNSQVDSAAACFYESGRAVGIDANNSELSEQQFFSLKSYPVHFSLPRNSLDDDMDELYAFMNWTQNSIDQNRWAIMMVHEVVPFTELVDLVNQGNYEPISNEWFTEFCTWLKNKSDSMQLWVATIGEVTKYIRERQNYNYNIVELTDSTILLNLTDNLDDEIYNYPLSCFIKVPNDWQAVQFSQNNITKTLFTVSTDSGNYVLAKIIPDGGKVTLKLTSPNSINSSNEIISEFMLEQNYPNPFNPSTMIRWQSPVGIRQTIKLYNTLGEEVDTIVDEFLEAGYHSKLYNINSTFPSGIYFYRLQAGSYSATKKMVLLR